MASLFIRPKYGCVLCPWIFCVSGVGSSLTIRGLGLGIEDCVRYLGPQILKLIGMREHANEFEVLDKRVHERQNNNVQKIAFGSFRIVFWYDPPFVLNY